MKKIRIAALFLALAMMGGALVGCGKKDTGDSFGQVMGGNNAAGGNANGGNSTGNGQTSGDDSTDDGPTSGDKITYDMISAGTNYNDGVVFLKIDESIYVADDKGNLLYNFTEKTGETYLDEKKLVYRNGVIAWGNNVYDKQGNIIASPEKTGYQEIFSEVVNGYILVGKYVEDFNGDRLYFGVINAKGEWVHGLSVNNALTSCMFEGAKAGYYSDVTRDLSSEYGRNRLRNIIEAPTTTSAVGLTEAGIVTYKPIDSDLSVVFVGTRSTGWIYYDLINDRVSENYPHAGTGQSEFDPEINWTHTVVSMFDSDGNEANRILTDYEAVSYFEGATLGLLKTSSGNSTKSKYVLASNDGEVLIDFGDYKIALHAEYHPLVWTGEYFICGIYNETGSLYGCVFNKNGELAFDPVRVDGGDYYLLTWTGGFMVATDNDNGTQLTAYDVKGGSKVLGSSFFVPSRYSNFNGFNISGGIVRIGTRYVTTDGADIFPMA